MSTAMKRFFSVVLAAAAIFSGACRGELYDTSSPVQLLVTNKGGVNSLDLAGGPGCDQNLGTFEIRSLVKNPTAPTSTFNDIRIRSYRVSYTRTDGGRTVPAPYVRTIDILVPSGGTADLSGIVFIILRNEDLRQAPFAALLPQNGGRDAETGRTVIRMEILVEMFGETLAGENVAGSVRFPLDFCFDCGGCA